MIVWVISRHKTSMKFINDAPVVLIASIKIIQKTRFMEFNQKDHHGRFNQSLAI